MQPICQQKPVKFTVRCENAINQQSICYICSRPILYCVCFTVYSLKYCKILQCTVNSILHAFTVYFYNTFSALSAAHHISFLLKGVLHPWALFLKTLCIFSKNKATSDKVSYGSGQKCSKELKNHSFTSVETIVVKLQ